MDLSVDAPVRQNPYLSLKEGEEEEDARALPRPVKPPLVERPERPFPHRPLFAPVAHEYPLEVGQAPEELVTGKGEEKGDGDKGPDRGVKAYGSEAKSGPPS